MKILRQLTDSHKRPIGLYLCQGNGSFLLFKEIKNPFAIEYEFFFQKLARKLSMPTLKFIKKGKIKGKTGILMEYLEDARLLYNHKEELTKKQKSELQRIVLLDILVANKDRHTANVFINKNIVPFDHDKILKGIERRASSFVKLDLGRKLDRDYARKLEAIIKGGNVSAELALTDYFGFSKKDIHNIKAITDRELSRIINSLSLPDEEKQRILYFLKYRRDNFDAMQYI